MIPFPYMALPAVTGSAAGDPYFANVISLVHFDGADTSTVIVDQKGKTWTCSGNTLLSTATKKYGTASLYNGTAGRCITTTDAGDAFGTGDFTIEFWHHPVSASGTRIIFDTRAAAGSVAPALYSAAGAIRYFTNGADRISGGSMGTGTSRHIALSRVSGTTRLFLDGTQTGSSYADANNYVNQIMCVHDASYTTGNPTQGYTDDLRVTKGVGRYTANFTPPAAAYPDA